MQDSGPGLTPESLEHLFDAFYTTKLGGMGMGLWPKPYKLIISIGMTYSLDFRRKAISVREQEGLTIAEVAARFGVGIASVVRWLKKLEPQRTRNKPATKIDMAALARDVRDFPDAYQYCQMPH
jgi:Transposase